MISDFLLMPCRRTLFVIGVIHHLWVIVVVLYLFGVVRRDHISFLLLVMGTWVSVFRGVAKNICFIVNIYLKCSSREKKVMWMDLLLRWFNLGGEVRCVLGDLNFVYSSSERIKGDGYINKCW